MPINWTGPYEVVAVGRCSSGGTPDGSPLGDNFLHLDLPPYLPGFDARRCVAIECCKPCANPHDSDDTPIYLPAGLRWYVLNNFPKKSPSYIVTQDDVSAPLQRLDMKQINGAQVGLGAW